MSVNDTDSDLGSRSQHVTAVITHRVRAGLTQEYEDWIKGISAAARAFEGHMGVSILRPQSDAQPDYVIVLQFDTCDLLTVWLNSETRNTWLERVQSLIEERENIQILTGLESWFQLPKQGGVAAPKRYKQAILVWIGVMIVALFVSPLIAPLLELLPWLMGVAVNVAITVGLLSYVIMPQLTRRFRIWLYAD
ncbi:MAG: antibiotic biosynthesis monooxygenase [Cyanobacteria bacterium J06642_2]